MVGFGISHNNCSQACTARPQWPEVLTSCVKCVCKTQATHLSLISH